MAQAAKKTNAKWRVTHTDHAARVVTMERGSEVAQFEMGSMRRIAAVAS